MSCVGIGQITQRPRDPAHNLADLRRLRRCFWVVCGIQALCVWRSMTRQGRLKRQRRDRQCHVRRPDIHRPTNTPYGDVCLHTTYTQISVHPSCYGCVCRRWLCWCQCCASPCCACACRAGARRVRRARRRNVRRQSHAAERGRSDSGGAG